MSAPPSRRVRARHGGPSLPGVHPRLRLPPQWCSAWGWAEIFQTPWVQPSPSLPHCLFLGHYVRQGEFVVVQSRSPDSLKPLRIYHPELLFVGLQDPLPHSRAQMLLCLLPRTCCPPGALTPLFPHGCPGTQPSLCPSHACLQRPVLGAGCCGHGVRGHVLPTGEMMAAAPSGFVPKGGGPGQGTLGSQRGNPPDP